MNTNEFRTQQTDYTPGLDPHREKKANDRRRELKIKLAIGATGVATAILLANSADKEISPDEIDRPGITVTVEPDDTLSELLRENNPNVSEEELEDIKDETIRENPGLGTNNPANPQISVGDQLVIPYTTPRNE